MIYTIYDLDTGLIVSRVRNSNQILNRPHVAGNWNPDRYRIVRGQPVPLPARPRAQSHVMFTFDAKHDQWTVDIPRTIDAARAQRNQYLALVDRMNPAWWQNLSPAQQSEFEAYRQALLDISKQPDWPVEIDWPAAPDWL